MSTGQAASLLNGAAAELLVAAERLPQDAKALRSYAAHIQVIASQAAEMQYLEREQSAE